MSLGSKVKSLREKQHLTQSELAKRSGITQATLSRCEHHLINQLKSDALRRLASELKTSVDFLVGKDDAISVEGVLRSDPDVRDFVDLYSKLDLSTREHVRSYMQYMINSFAGENVETK